MSNDIRPLAGAEIDTVSGGNAAVIFVVGWLAGRALDKIADALEDGNYKGPTVAEQAAAGIKKQFGIK